MTNMDILVKLGRFMITTAPQFVDDAQFNNWARVGSLLTELGMPFAPTLREFDAEDQATVREAAAVMGGRAALPDQIKANTVAAAVEPRRTRRARMTQAMAKPVKAVNKAVKPVKSAKAVKSVVGEPKRRGRPPGSKNKPKVAAVTTNKRGRASKGM